MRLFVALDIDDAIRDRIMQLVEGIRNFAPDARWMRPESMHVTLKFIGEQPESALEDIQDRLSNIDSTKIEIKFCSYGFFPTAKSARVFWIGMQSGPELARLAASIDQSLSAVGIPKEQRAFSPHLTLARSAGGSGSPRRNTRDKPNRAFQVLQERLAALPTPEFGIMTSREFFLYQSHLSPEGSKYTKLASFPLT